MNIKKNIFSHMSVKAWGRGINALADMFAKNASFFWMATHSLQLHIVILLSFNV